MLEIVVYVRRPDGCDIDVSIICKRYGFTPQEVDQLNPDVACALAERARREEQRAS